MSRKVATGEIQVPAGILPDRQVVLHLQRDALRIAYLLTGDPDRARDLTARAFIEQLGYADQHHDPAQLYDDLLLTIARLDCEDTGRYSPAPPAGEASESGEQAGDERSRLRAALDDLARPARAALVLRDVAGIELEQVAPLYDLEPVALRFELNETRQRLLAAARPLDDEPLRRLITGLAVDTPRHDLWPEVGPRLGEIRAARRRRNRLITGGIVAAALLVLLGGAAWFFSDALLPSWWNDGENAAAAIETATPAPTRPPRPTATSAPTPTLPPLLEAGVSSDLLVTVYGENPDERRQDRLMVYDPKTQAFSDPFGDANEVYVSPDGRWTLIARRVYGEVRDPYTGETYEGLRTFYSAMRSDGERMGWEIEASPGTRDPAIAGDRLYLAMLDIFEGSRVSVYDLYTGDEIASQPLDLPVLGDEAGDEEAGLIYFESNFIHFPDESDPRLFLLTRFWDYSSAVGQPRLWDRRLYRIDVDELMLTSLYEQTFDRSDTTDAQERDLWNWRSITPDGTALWSWQYGFDGREDAVHFLDLESGEVETLTIPFMPVDITGINRPVRSLAIPSNSGRQLYVISSLSSEVAIVGLVARQVERRFMLDKGEFAHAALDYWQHALSHDGRYLYVAESTVETSPRSIRATPIWVIDLSEWRIVRRLEAEGQVNGIHPSVDGARLHILSQVPHSNPERSRQFLTTLDTATGEVIDRLEDSGSDGVGWGWLTTPASVYRQEYGRAPVIDGVETQDLTEYTTLPRVEIVPEEEAMPLEVTREVDIRFLDPVTGREIGRSNDHVRLDRDLPLTLVFEHPGAKSVVTVPVELDPGTQSGSFRPRVPGTWSARVNLGDPENGGWSVEIPDVLTVIEPLEATDGHSYYLRLTTDPPEPLDAGEEVTLRGVFVETRTGEPLPEGVELVGGMPEGIFVSLYQTGGGSRIGTIERLQPAGHGVYEDTMEFSEPGAWDMRYNFRLPESDDEAIRVTGGRIEVTGEQEASGG